MCKKISKSVLILAALGLVFSSLVTQVPDNTKALPEPTREPIDSVAKPTSWTVAEAIAYEAEFEAKLDTICDSASCKDIARTEEEARRGRYYSLQSLKSSRFNVTVINPTENYIKAVYFDEEYDMMFGGSTGNRQPLRSIYLGWFDEGHWDEIYNYDRALFMSGRILGEHTVHEGINSSEGAYLFTSGVEVTLPAFPDANLGANPRDELAIAADGNNYSTQGRMPLYGYHDCLEALGGLSGGVECRLTYVTGGGWRFAPAALASPIDTPASTDTPIVPTDPTEGSETNQNDPSSVADDIGSPSDTVTDPTSTENGSADSVEGNMSGDNPNNDNVSESDGATGAWDRLNSVATATYQAPTTPSVTSGGLDVEREVVADVAKKSAQASSIASSVSSERSVGIPETATTPTSPEFPWWLLIIVVASLGLGFWWLLPTRKNKNNSN